MYKYTYIYICIHVYIIYIYILIYAYISIINNCGSFVLFSAMAAAEPPQGQVGGTGHDLSASMQPSVGSGDIWKIDGYIRKLMIADGYWMIDGLLNP